MPFDGDKLREFRRCRALSLRDLAARSGVAHDTIYAIEVGHQEPRPVTLRKLASALGVDPEVFFNWKAFEHAVEALTDEAEDARADAEDVAREEARMEARDEARQRALDIVNADPNARFEDVFEELFEEIFEVVFNRAVASAS